MHSDRCVDIHGANVADQNHFTEPLTIEVHLTCVSVSVTRVEFLFLLHAFPVLSARRILLVFGYAGFLVLCKFVHVQL